MGSKLARIWAKENIMPLGAFKAALMGAGTSLEYTYTKDHIVGGYGGVGYKMTNQVYTASSNTYAVGTAYAIGTDVGYFDHAQTINGKTGMAYLPGGAVRTDASGSENTDNNQSYGFSADTFANLTAMTVAIASATTGIIDDNIYTAGGATSRTCNNYTNYAYEYGIGSDTWSTMTQMGTSRMRSQGFGMQVKDGSEMFVVGGMTANCHPTYTEVDNVDGFTPSGDTWAAKTAIPVTCAMGMQSGMGDYIYSSGGDLDGSGRADTTYRYSPSGNSWVTRTSSASTQQNGWAYPIISGGSTYLYTQGGDVEGENSDETNSYSEASNTWTSRATMTSAGRWDP